MKNEKRCEDCPCPNIPCKEGDCIGAEAERFGREAEELDAYWDIEILDNAATNTQHAVARH